MNIALVSQISGLTEASLYEVIAECGYGTVVGVCRDLFEQQRLQQMNLIPSPTN